MVRTASFIQILLSILESDKIDGDSGQPIDMGVFLRG